MAVSSIIIYDIYQVYITPFKKDLAENACILCGLQIAKNTENGRINVGTFCDCPSSKTCFDCQVLLKFKFPAKS